MTVTCSRQSKAQPRLDEPDIAGRADALLERAEAAQSSSLHRRALDVSTMALNLRPAPERESRLRELRSRSWAALGSFDAALNELRQALHIAPEGDPKRRAALGKFALAAERFDEATSWLQEALELDPERLDLLLLLGEALCKNRRQREACSVYLRARELSPRDATLAVRLAQTLQATGRYTEAAEQLDLALQLEPTHIDALVALSGLCHSRGQNERSTSLSRRALELDDTRADAHMSLAVSLLRRGQYREGFREYEWRLPAAGSARRFGLLPWDGAELSGETLVLLAEQGLGDTLQFVRFAREAQRAGARTVLVVPERLHRLLTRCAGIDRLEIQGLQCPAGHRYSMLMSLPHLLGLSPFACRAVPYLSPEPERVAFWAARLADKALSNGAGKQRFRVAVAWQGNPDYAGDVERSLPLSSLEPLLGQARHEVRFVSLQRGRGSEQIHPNRHQRLITLGEQLDADAAFVDSAAVISTVELVITTDTALAHLAGALGARTWLLLGYAAEWRWGADPLRTHWYPSMRLFRQAAPGDWAGVIAEVGRALAALVAA